MSKKADLYIEGTLSKDFSNVIEKEEYKVNNRTQIKEGIFVSVKNPVIEGDIDTSGMSEGFIPNWCKGKTDYYNGKTSFALQIIDENNNKVNIDELGGLIPYGSKVKVALKLSNGYYYPFAIKIFKFNDEIVEDNPFD